MTSSGNIQSQIEEIIQDLIAKREIIEQCLKDRLAELGANPPPSPSAIREASVSSYTIKMPKGSGSVASKPESKSATNPKNDVQPYLFRKGNRKSSNPILNGHSSSGSNLNELNSSSRGMSADQSNDKLATSKNNSTSLLSQSMRQTSSKASLTSSSSKGSLKSSTGKRPLSSTGKSVPTSQKGVSKPSSTKTPASSKSKPETPSRDAPTSDKGKTPTTSPRGGIKPPPTAVPPEFPKVRRSLSVTRAAAAKAAEKSSSKASQAEQPNAKAPPAKKPPRRAQSVKKSLMPKVRPVPA